jgi:hypothetical protein
VAPPWHHDRSLEKATKNRGRPFWASSEERVDLKQAHLSTHLGLALDSLPLTLCSPALRVGAGKSGVGEGEWKVMLMQISVVLGGKTPELPKGPRGKLSLSALTRLKMILLKAIQGHAK